MDDTLRTAERELAADPTAWRPVLALLLRAGRQQDALAMLEATEERLYEAGRGLGRAAQMEAIVGATERRALAALVAHSDALLRVADARLALANDLALARRA